MMASWLTLRQKSFGVFEFGGQVAFDDVVQAVLGEGLLFDADAHLEHLFDRFAPGFVHPG